ncbi:hypothetical protein PIB30_088198, partial [Stylosanthes scabra]|nr:hypothetical protein [Stylosanthes scabra]
MWLLVDKPLNFSTNSIIEWVYQRPICCDFIRQGEWKSKSLDCVFITTGGSSGAADYLKVLKVLDRVFFRQSVEFKKKIDQTRFEFEVHVQLGIPSRLVFQCSACVRR